MSSKDDELDINKYPRAVISPMAAFEIAVGEYEKSSKSEHFYRKLRIARKEFAEAIIQFGIQERIDELERNKQKVCICDEAGINACDALWHHRNNIDQRIVELTALKDKETP